jgi:hypothetical protein
MPLLIMGTEKEAQPRPRPGRMAKRMAERVLEEYAASGMNATEAAKRAGYKESTANARGYDIVAIATKRLLDAAREENRKPSLSETRTVLELLGLTPVEVLREYVKVVGQDRDLASKLKALGPLMSSLHAAFAQDENQQKAPSVAIVVENNLDNQGNYERVAQSTFRDTITDIDVVTPEPPMPIEGATSPVAESE